MDWTVIALAGLAGLQGLVLWRTWSLGGHVTDQQGLTDLVAELSAWRRSLGSPASDPAQRGGAPAPDPGVPRFPSLEAVRAHALGQAPAAAEEWWRGHSLKFASRHEDGGNVVQLVFRCQHCNDAFQIPEAVFLTLMEPVDGPRR